MRGVASLGFAPKARKSSPRSSLEPQLNARRAVGLPVECFKEGGDLTLVRILGGGLRAAEGLAGRPRTRGLCLRRPRLLLVPKSAHLTQVPSGSSARRTGNCKHAEERGGRQKPAEIEGREGLIEDPDTHTVCVTVTLAPLALAVVAAPRLDDDDFLCAVSPKTARNATSGPPSVAFAGEGAGPRPRPLPRPPPRIPGPGPSPEADLPPPPRRGRPGPLARFGDRWGRRLLFLPLRPG